MAESVSKQLGDEAHRYFILCHRCWRKLEGDAVFMLALFGQQGMTDDDAVLLCVDWRDRAPAFLFASRQFACDGCGRLVAVAPSSAWFIDHHRAERI